MTKFTLRITRLLVLIIILSPCSVCWCCFCKGEKKQELYLSQIKSLEQLLENLIEKNYLGEALDFESLLKVIPTSIDSLPRLIIGQGQVYRSEIIDVGCITLRDQDITMDFNQSPKPDVCGDVWDIDTVKKIKDIYTGKFSAIIFERVSIMPLYWSAYLRELCARSDNTFYQLPYPDSAVTHRAYSGATDNRFILKDIYEQGRGFFHEVKEVKLPTLNHHESISNSFDTDYPAPELVDLVKSDKALFPEGIKELPQLEQVLKLELKPFEKNEVLEAYYDLLEPGGIIIFSSSAGVINRHGGLLVGFQERRYTPFKNLDDLHMQAIYRSIFERAGFKDVKFYKDPYYMEQVIVLVATK